MWKPVGRKERDVRIEHVFSIELNHVMGGWMGRCRWGLLATRRALTEAEC